MNAAFRIAAGFAASALCSLVPLSEAAAQAWPSRTVRIIIPFTPGGTPDLTGRLLAEKLAPILGQPFIVENRTGAAGDLASDYVAKQPGDGHTLLVNANVAASAIFKSLPYDPYKDLAPISALVNVTLVLAANPGIPSGSLGELVAYARANPGKLSYGSPGVATPQHFASELLRQLTKIDVVHVPYKGAAQVVPALLAGEIAFAVNAANTVMPHVPSGKLRLVAVPMPTKSALMPNVPTMAETLPSFDLPTTWLALYASGGTPSAIIDRLNVEANRIVRDPQIIKERLHPIGLEPVGTTPGQLADMIKTGFAKFSSIAKEGNIRP